MGFESSSYDRKLWAHVRRLQRLITREGSSWAALEATAPLRLAIGQAMSSWWDKRQLPPRRKLLKVLWAYESLPEAMRRRLASGRDGAIFLPEPLRSRATGVTLDDLVMEVERLAYLVARKYRRGSILRGFRPWYNARDNGPSFAELWQMREFFYELPRETQREILNGWEPWPTRDTEAQVLETIATHEGLARVLLLEAYGDQEAEQRRKEGLSTTVASQIVAYCETTAPVELRIKEGASKEEALQGLRAITDLLDCQWEKLIAEPFRRGWGDDALNGFGGGEGGKSLEQNGPPTGAPVASTPASRESEDVGAAAAA